jgi:hypothetical protein
VAISKPKYSMKIFLLLLRNLCTITLNFNCSHSVSRTVFVFMNILFPSRQMFVFVATFACHSPPCILHHSRDISILTTSFDFTVLT